MSTVRANWLMLEGSSFSVDGFSRMWLVAAATYGVGDIVTTIAIVYFMPTLTEANPAIRLAIQTFGGGGFLGLKLLVLPRLYRNQSGAGSSTTTPCCSTAPGCADALRHRRDRDESGAPVCLKRRYGALYSRFSLTLYRPIRYRVRDVSFGG